MDIPHSVYQEGLSIVQLVGVFTWKSLCEHMFAVLLVTPWGGSAPMETLIIVKLLA